MCFVTLFTFSGYVRFSSQFIIILLKKLPKETLYASLQIGARNSEHTWRDM